MVIFLIQPASSSLPSSSTSAGLYNTTRLPPFSRASLLACWPIEISWPAFFTSFSRSAMPMLTVMLVDWPPASKMRLAIEVFRSSANFWMSGNFLRVISAAKILPPNRATWSLPCARSRNCVPSSFNTLSDASGPTFSSICEKWSGLMISNAPTPSLPRFLRPALTSCTK